MSTPVSTQAATAVLPERRGLISARMLTAVVILALALSWNFLPDFTIVLLCYIGLYSMVALGLVMLTGVGGMTSFGQAAFVGVGAYATAWVCTRPWLSMPWVACLAPRLCPGWVWCWALSSPLS